MCLFVLKLLLLCELFFTQLHSEKFRFSTQLCLITNSDFPLNCAWSKMQIFPLNCKWLKIWSFHYTVRHEKFRFSTQLASSLVLRESKRHILSIGKIYKMTRTNLTMCLFVKKLLLPFEKIRFSTQLVSSLVLKGVKKAHFTIGKIENVSKLTKCASLFPNFCLIKNSDISP